MTGRILIVDDLPANTKLLEARLSAEYYDVQTVDNGKDAIEICKRDECDIVLLDVMMPGLSGFDVCRILKGDPTTVHIPIVLVTALDQTRNRIEGLEAGADDFLTKPVSEVSLIARVKSLIRLKMLTDELRLRTLTEHDVSMGLPNPIDAKPNGAKILLVDDRQSSSVRLTKQLTKAGYAVDLEMDIDAALEKVASIDYTIGIVSIDLKEYDGLRLCARIRDIERTRNLPLLILADPGEDTRLTRGLELGVNDYITRPIEHNEMLARCGTQVRRKRYNDFLNTSFVEAKEMAVKDALTGLYNRRYLETHLTKHLNQSREKNTPLSIMVLDIDHFKAVNDTYGHDGGDDILKDFSVRICDNIRRVDLPCRFGGEEFVVIMPDTDQGLAFSVAERIRQVVETRSFSIVASGQQADITTSIGIASFEGGEETPETLLKRADVALYKAKNEGRNQVIFGAAA